MVLQLLRKQPLLLALGLGGHTAPSARLLAGSRWRASTLPFFFRVVRPFRVLRRLSYARQRWWLRWAMEGAAWSGLGWAAHWAHQGWTRRSPDPRTTAIDEGSFAGWADSVWHACRDAYPAL